MLRADGVSMVGLSCQGLQGGNGDVEQVGVGAERGHGESPEVVCLTSGVCVTARPLNSRDALPAEGCLPGGGVLVFCRGPNRAPQTRRLKIAEFTLSQSGAPSLKSRCGWGRAHQRLWGVGGMGGSFLPLPPPGGSWACGHLPPVCLRLHLPSPWVCVPPLTYTRIPVTGIWACLDPG